MVRLAVCVYPFSHPDQNNAPADDVASNLAILFSINRFRIRRRQQPHRNNVLPQVFEDLRRRAQADGVIDLLHVAPSSPPPPSNCLLYHMLVDGI
jgi:hypothetical protein